VRAYGLPMRRIVGVVGWGVVGAVVAVALIAGAFAVAGTSLTQPASAVRVVTGPPLRPDTPDHHEAADPSPDEATSTSAPSPAGDASSVVTGVVGRSTSAPQPPGEDGGPERGDD